MSLPTPLLNVTIAVPVDGGVKNHHLKPAAQWYVFGCSNTLNDGPLQVG